MLNHNKTHVRAFLKAFQTNHCCIVLRPIKAIFYSIGSGENREMDIGKISYPYFLNYTYEYRKKSWLIWRLFTPDQSGFVNYFGTLAFGRY